MAKWELPVKYKDLPEEKRKELLARFKKMQYEVGEAIGVIAAQSISEPATQTTLRSYHSEGRTQLVTTKGLPRLLEIFDARKEPKTPTMTIFLDNEHNNKEESRRIAARIKETKLKHVLDSDSLDLINMTIEIIPNKEKMMNLDVKIEDIAALIKKRVKNLSVEVEGNSIKLVAKKDLAIKDMQNVRVKARNMYIKGIKGIDQAIVEENKGRWVIRTIGSNLKKVMKMKGIDRTKTRSNNIYEIAEILGIEAARNAIVRETIETMREQGVDTDIRHLLLVADAMTNDGEIKAIGRYGLAGEKSSVLSRANFEETVKHLTAAAVSGEIDPLDSIIENIIVGNLAPIGTGMVKLKIKE